MTWLKFLNQIMHKYQRISLQKNKQENLKHCYSTGTASVQHVPSLVDANGTSLLNSWPRNTFRIEFQTNTSMCGSCRKTRTKTLFCKCCGQTLKDKKKSVESENVLNFDYHSRQKLVNGRPAIHCNIYKNSTFKANSLKLIKRNQHLKKSKAMTDIKMKQQNTTSKLFT